MRVSELKSKKVKCNKLTLLFVTLSGQAIFEKGNAPANDDYNEQGLRLVRQMTVPSECHKDIRQHQQDNRGDIRTSHKLEVQRSVQFLYLPRQTMLVKHFHEWVGIELFDIPNASA